jgi:molybdopterin-guanine dinucleotide biosynthesis protein A
VSALVAVLAGERGRRMGAPKALAELAGEPVIARPLAAATAAGLDAVVVAKPDTALPPLGVPVWEEPATPVHPLRSPPGRPCDRRSSSSPRPCSTRLPRS